MSAANWSQSDIKQGMKTKAYKQTKRQHKAGTAQKAVGNGALVGGLAHMGVHGPSPAGLAAAAGGAYIAHRGTIRQTRANTAGQLAVENHIDRQSSHKGIDSK